MSAGLEEQPVIEAPSTRAPAVKAKPSPLLYGCVTVSTLAWGVFGFDTGSIGAITEMAAFEATFGHLSPIVRGLTVSSILLPSALTGVLAGPLSDRISRKRTTALGAAMFALGSAICCGVNSLAALIVARCVAGAGEGLFLSSVTTYTTEISPRSLRGRFVSATQFGTSSSIAIGFFCCYGFSNAPTLANSTWSYRLPFLIQIVLSTILCVASLCLPFSPRWLALKGRAAEAEHVLELMQKPGAEIEKDMLEAPTTKGASAPLFSPPTVAFRTLFGCYLQASQQLSGIDAVLYYAPVLFAQAGLSGNTTALVASGVTGIVLLLSTAVASPFMDRVGRKTLMVSGGAVLAFALTTIGILYASDATAKPAGRYTVIALIEVYVIAFSSTWAMCCRLYASEIQPNATRAAATSLGQGVNQAVNFLVALTTPLFLARSSSGPYLLYGALTAVATVSCATLMIETRGKSLEAIDREYATFKPRAPEFSAFVSSVRTRLSKDSAAHRRASFRQPRPSAVQMERLSSDMTVPTLATT